MIHRTTAHEPAADAAGRAHRASRERDPGGLPTGAGQAPASADRRGHPPVLPLPAPSHRRAPARAWAAAAGALAALVLVLGVALPALAQTSVTLVSNTGKSTDITSSFTTDMAQSFRTGSSPAGYKLTSVDIRRFTATGTAPTYTVTIHENSGTNPGATSLGTLTHPTWTANTTENARYTASGTGIDLDADTTYWVVVDVSTTNSNANIKGTHAKTEDSGKARGWSIGDENLSRAAGSTGVWTSHTSPFQIAVNGYDTDTTAPTLSGTAVNRGTLTFTFSEDLNTGSAPVTSAFRVEVGGTQRSVSSVSVGRLTRSDGSTQQSGPSVELTLSPGVTATDTVTVRYTKPTSGNTLKDWAGNEVATFGAQTADNNTTGPKPLSAEATGNEITIYFDTTDRPVAATVPPERFRYTRGGSRVEHTPSVVALSGNQVTLTLRHVIVSKEAVTVRYIAPASGNDRLRNIWGPTPSFTLDEVTVATTDRVGPRPVSAETGTDGLRLGIQFDEGININTADYQPLIDALTVKVDGTERALASHTTDPPRVAIGGLLVLTLSSAVAPGETVTVSFTSGQTTIEDASASPNLAPSFTDFPVENLVLSGSIASVAITSTPAHDADGDNTPETYKRRQQIEVTVTWDSAVTWDVSASGAELRVRLEVGSKIKAAKLVTGGETSGTARALRFRYQVAGVDSDTDGIEVQPTAGGDLVVLHSGATLELTNGEAAETEHAGLGAQAGHKVDGVNQSDTTAPSLSSVTLVTTVRESPTLTLVYDEALDELEPPTASRFSVSVAGDTTTHDVEAVAVSNTAVVLTLSAPVVAGQAIALSYAADGDDAVTDVSGNKAANFSGESVSNPDGAPVALSAELTVEPPGNYLPSGVQSTGRSTVVVTFDENLDASQLPPASQFAQNFATQSGRNATGRSISGNKLTVRWPYAFRHDWEPTLFSYSGPSSAPPHLQDLNGLTLTGVWSWPVTDLTPPLVPQSAALTADGTGIVLTFDRFIAEIANPTDEGNIHAFRIRGAAAGVYGDLSPVRVTLDAAAAGETVTVWMDENHPVKAGQKVRLSYRPGDGGTLKDQAGYPVARFIDFPVENRLGGNMSGEFPVLVGAQVFTRAGDSALRLRYDRALDESSAPAGNWFTVHAMDPNDDIRDVRGTTDAAVIVGTDVEVTLSGPVHGNEVASVSYRKPSSNPIRDTDGNAAASLERERAAMRDERPPEFQTAVIVKGDEMWLYYDEPLDPGSVPPAGMLTASWNGTACRRSPKTALI